ncbi:mitochondrial 54S ribosomal mL53 domain-containing protein [Calcarisporiella thermophila]|uniref:mitochondrial 54S ribosomal mL53 domain-containing protein n=1 Tax=Calcarisporiella thermophila TaxID=911321 RepID=UPI003743036A
MSNFIKYIDTLKISFSPFHSSPGTKSSRIFLSRVMTAKARLINPNLKLTTSLLSGQAPSQILVTYRDGKKLEISPDKSNMKIDDVLGLVNEHARKLQEKEEASS